MRKFGIEIEAIGASKETVARIVRSTGVSCSAGHWMSTDSSNWKVVADTSIGHNLGFELVSPPLPLNEDGLNEVKKVLKALNETIDIQIRKTCGLHVHIGVEDLTPQHIANIVKRYAKHELGIDAFMAPSRRNSNNTFCKSLRRVRMVTPNNRSQISSMMNCRYYKVNVKSYVKFGTLEFRHHGSSTEFKKISSWILFLNQFIDASAPTVTQNATSVVSGLSGKSRRVYEILEDSPTTAHDLAERLNSTVKSIQSMICVMKRNGVEIVKNGRAYMVRASSSTSLSVSSNLWDGVCDSLREYFTMRAEVLA